MTKRNKIRGKEISNSRSKIKGNEMGKTRGELKEEEEKKKHFENANYILSILCLLDRASS